MAISFRSLAAGAATALTVFTQAAAADNEGTVRDFYLTVTKDAFEATYGDDLTPESIETLSFGDVDKSTLSDERIAEAYAESIRAVLYGTTAEYQENYVGAAREYFESLTPEQLQGLENALNYQYSRPGRDGNLLGVLDDDMRPYLRNRVSNPTPETTNALFYAFYELEQKDMLTEKGRNDWISLAKTLTHGKDSLEPMHQSLISEIDAIQETAPVIEPVAPVPENKF